MRSATVILLLGAVAEAQFVKPGHRQALHGIRAPQQRLNPPFPSMSQRSHPSSPQEFPFQFPPLSQRSNPAATVAAAAEETKAAPKVVEDEEAENMKEEDVVEPTAKAPAGQLNIYGEAMQSCISQAPTVGQRPEDAVPGGYCPADGVTTPQVCVDIKPLDGEQNIFKSVFGWNRIGPTGPKCVPVWALGAKELSKNSLYGTGDFSLECNALPSDILEGGYTKDEYNNCEYFFKDYPCFSQESHLQQLAGKEYISDKTYVSNAINGRCTRFRRSIEFLCSVCADRAGSETAKAELGKKCNALATSAIEEPRGSHATPGLLCLGSFMLALIGLTMFRSFHKRVQALQEPLLHA